MEFKCSRCGYKSAFKQCIQNHFKRRNICKPLLAECTPSIIQVESIPPLSTQPSNPIEAHPALQRQTTPNHSNVETHSQNTHHSCGEPANNTEKTSDNPTDNHVENNQKQLNKKKDKKKDEKKTFQCHKCLKFLSRSDKLKSHLKICTGPKPMIKCPNCTEVFSTNALFTKHAQLCTGNTTQSVEPTGSETITENTTDNTTTNTKNITIVLNCYGKEGLDQITPEYIQYLIDQANENPDECNINMTENSIAWTEVADNN